MSRMIKITLKKSLNSATKKQKQTAGCLGLRKISQSRQFKDSPALRGQVRQIQHLLNVEEI